MRADRLVKLLMLLQRHRRVTASWLADELEVSTRTVLRDMEALSAAGIPVYTEQGRGGGCVLMDGYTTQASGLTPTEAQALFAWTARESVQQLGLGGELSSALAKIAASAPTQALAHAEAMGQVVAADRRRWNSPDDDVAWLPDLRAACVARRRIRAAYRSAEAVHATTSVLDPVGVVDQSGRWYLVAERDGRPRMFRVSRFESVEVLEEPVQRQDPRPVGAIWAELRARFEEPMQAVDVVLAVTPEKAGVVRRLLRMQLAPGSDIAVDDAPPNALAAPAGMEIWRLSVRMPDVIAATAVLFAPAMVVLEPASMRDSIADGARRALEVYGDEAR